LCGVSRPTISSYLDLLAETHLVHVVPPFVGGKRAEVTGRPKVFFADNGLRNAVARAFQPFDDRLDRGPLFENWVVAELIKRHAAFPSDAPVRYWRSASGAEVDAVLEADDGLTGVEVKASALQRPELSRSARSFLDAYRPVRFVVVNLALVATEDVGGTAVHWVGPEWLAADGSDRPGGRQIP
jgi:predicted AAA+ superfamily ATPase